MNIYLLPELLRISSGPSRDPCAIPFNIFKAIIEMDHSQAAFQWRETFNGCEDASLTKMYFFFLVVVLTLYGHVHALYMKGSDKR